MLIRSHRYDCQCFHHLRTHARTPPPSPESQTRLPLAAPSALTAQSTSEQATGCGGRGDRALWPDNVVQAECLRFFAGLCVLAQPERMRVPRGESGGSLEACPEDHQPRASWHCLRRCTGRAQRFEKRIYSPTIEMCGEVVGFQNVVCAHIGVGISPSLARSVLYLGAACAFPIIFFVVRFYHERIQAIYARLPLLPYFYLR